MRTYGEVPVVGDGIVNPATGVADNPFVPNMPYKKWSLMTSNKIIGGLARVVVISDGPIDTTGFLWSGPYAEAVARWGYFLDSSFPGE